MIMSSNGQSSKSGANNGLNMPQYGPTSQWQGTSVSYMPSMAPLNQLVGLASRPPLWPPLGQPPYNYFNGPYGPAMPPPPPPHQQPPPGVHSHHCCCSNYHHSMDHQCNSNGWPPSSGSHGGDCWSPPHRNNDSASVVVANGASIVESITEIRNDDSTDDESTKSSKKESDLQKQLKQTKAINKGLKSSLQEATTQLSDIQEALLKMNEKLAIDYIEKYQLNLKKYGSHIREELNRFIQNQTIAKKLEPIVDQMKMASKKATEEKERLKQLYAAKRDTIKDDVTIDFDDISFDPKSLPEFPNLFDFYKYVLDEIPIIFFNDLNQIKRFASNCVQSSADSLSDDKKNSLNSFTIAANNMTSDGNLPSPSQSLFQSFAPTAKDLPKPDFSLLSLNDSSMNTLPLKSAEPVVSSALELTFPRSHSPIQVTSQLSNSATELIHSSTSLRNGIQSSVGKDLSAIGEPVFKKPVATVVSAAESDVLFRQPRNAPVFGPSVTPTTAIAAPKPSIGTIPLPSDLASATAPRPGGPESKPAASGPKVPLNQSQSKLLAKLKDKYPNLEDELLVDSMAQTKTALMNSGNPKGFTGMKVSEIISKISDYIDRNVVMMNNFAKSRSNKPIPTLKLMTDNLADAFNSHQKPSYEIKAWTSVSHKKGSNDDVICSICMEAMFKSTRYETECHHFFHQECITNWTRTDNTCPICRSHVLPPGEYPVL